jgi:hypothetical protein
MSGTRISRASFPPSGMASFDSLRDHPEDPCFVQFTYSDGTTGNCPRVYIHLIPHLEEIHTTTLRQLEEVGVLPWERRQQLSAD